MQTAINPKKILFFALAFVSFFPMISPPVALFLGIMYVNIFGMPIKGTAEVTKKLLQYSIIGLGFGINLKLAKEAGSQGFLFSVTSIILVLILGTLLGKLLRVDRIITQLISVGTAICGGSAIAAISPIVKANNHQNSVALGIVFVLNTVALFIFPEIGHYFQLSDQQFGIWAAIAIHDTSSVVGAASKYSDHALQIATTVKLVRALWIIPIAVVFSIFTKTEGKIKIPYFIGGFVVAILLNSYLPFLQPISPKISEISKDLLKVALFFIGTGLSFKILKNIGLKPLILGILLWFIISVTSLFAVIELVK